MENQGDKTQPPKVEEAGAGENKLLTQGRDAVSKPDQADQNRNRPGELSPYGFHQGDKSTLKSEKTTPSSLELSDPFSFHQGDKKNPPAKDKNDDGEKQKPKFDADIQKNFDAQMDAFKKQLAESNFQLNFGSGDGPYQALTKQRDAALAKSKSGGELTPQEKALSGLSNDEIHKESVRMRDRDFQTMKTEDGKPRNWYSTKDHPNRWSEEEMSKMVKDQEQNLLAKAQEAQKKLDESRAAEALKSMDLAVDKSLPPVETLEKAKAASGLQVDMTEFRQKLAEQIKSELKAGSLKPNDLEKPPRVGAVYVASGTVSQQELSSALDEQARLKAENKGPVPRLGDIIRSRLSPERATVFDQASKFYDELKKQLTPPAEKK